MDGNWVTFCRILWLGLFLGLTGCQADYYWHLFCGQARIVLNCQPIDKLLADPDLDPHTAEKLALVERVRTFARDRIGLEHTSNYTCLFDTRGQPVSWNVSASPPDRFTPFRWKFPIVGALPYKGFFDRNLGLQERDALQEQGFDVYLRPVSAYSTLGFFSDPVFSTMLDYSEERLADLILHELTHATVFAEGHTDFNESLATFIGQKGSQVFLAERYGPDSSQLEEVSQRRADAARFRDFMQEIVASLDSLYGRGLPRETVLEERQEVFAQAQARYKTIRREFKAVNFDGFLKWEVNNARLLSYRRYHRDLELFEDLYVLKARRLKQVLALCQACEKAEDPWICVRGSVASGRGAD